LDLAAADSCGAVPVARRSSHGVALPDDGRWSPARRRLPGPV